MRTNTVAILLFHGGAFCHSNLSVKGAPLSERLFSTGSKLPFQPSKGVHESPQGHLWNPDVATDGLQEVSYYNCMLLFKWMHACLNDGLFEELLATEGPGLLPMASLCSVIVQPSCVL
jgi:hypothetical protein